MTENELLIIRGQIEYEQDHIRIFDDTRTFTEKQKAELVNRLKRLDKLLSLLQKEFGYK